MFPKSKYVFQNPHVRFDSDRQDEGTCQNPNVDFEIHICILKCTFTFTDFQFKTHIFLKQHKANVDFEMQMCV